MDEQFKAKLLSYMDKVEAGLQKGADFAEQEIPLAIQEWLVWLAVERFAYAAAYLALAAIFVWLYRATTKETHRLIRENEAAEAEDRKKPHDEDGIVACHVVRIILFILTVGVSLGAASWSLHGVKVLIAPRVVLVEEVAKLVKDVKK